MYNWYSHRKRSDDEDGGHAAEEGSDAAPDEEIPGKKKKKKRSSKNKDKDSAGSGKKSKSKEGKEKKKKDRAAAGTKKRSTRGGAFAAAASGGDSEAGLAEAMLADDGAVGSPRGGTAPDEASDEHKPASSRGGKSKVKSDFDLVLDSLKSGHRYVLLLIVVYAHAGTCGMFRCAPIYLFMVGIVIRGMYLRSYAFSHGTSLLCACSRPSKKKDEAEEAEQVRQVQEVIARMQTAFADDVEAFEQKQPATAKLRYLNEAVTQLRRKQLQEMFINGDVLGMCVCACLCALSRLCGDLFPASFFLFSSFSPLNGALTCVFFSYSGDCAVAAAVQGPHAAEPHHPRAASSSAA